MGVLPHPAPLSEADYSAMELAPGNDAVFVLDQRRLPLEEEYHTLRTVDEVVRAIADMVVRGAPAIGITAAYGMVLAARSGESLEASASLLKAARPTAVNLAWAVDQMLAAAQSNAESDRVDVLAAAARRIHREDVAACRKMGRLGAERIPPGATILTHCNAGALATGGYGTALGVIVAASDAGKGVRVLADETRPYLQGARLTAWELKRRNIPVEIIVDSSAGYFFARREISVAVVGSDRIAANGDVANKIGTYGVASLARQHDTPFFVAAPWSTVDEACPTGDDIVIEERSPGEVTDIGERRLVPQGVGARNPAFDVTPARLVSAIFTERGVIEPVGPAAIARLGAGQGHTASGLGGKPPRD